MTFRVKSNPGTKTPLAAHIRMFVAELTCLKDAGFLSIDKKKAFNLNNDKFPEDEEIFKEFFFIHPLMRKTAHLVVVGCIICSNKTIANLKAIIWKPV